MENLQCHIESPLGVIKIVQSDEMISEVLFMDDPVSNEINASSELLNLTCRELQLFFDGVSCDFTFLSRSRQTGTNFQQNVWKELMRIPVGKTISYRQLAIRLGDEKCIRAAASANGQNKIAIAVPCHRVIGTDGSLTGYAGGLWRKKWLLEHEAKMIGQSVQSSLFG